jgi:thiol-disulfide isomerase/thioredoxin
MKKNFKIIIVLIIILVSFFLYTRFNPISEIPSFEYETLESNAFSDKSIENSNKNIVFIYFSCKCNDCKELINDIENYKRLQNRHQILLITTEKNIAVIKKFINYEKIKELNIPVLIDNKNNFPSDFSLGISIELPKIIVFDKNKKLLKDVNSFEELGLL